MSLMVCFKCGRGPLVDGTTLYRQNEKGVDPIMACQEHNQKPIDQGVFQLVSVIESDGKTKH